MNRSKIPKSTNAKNHLNKRMFNQIRYGSTGGILKSPLGSCGPIPNENVVEHLYKDMEQWIEEPATVSIVKDQREMNCSTDLHRLLKASLTTKHPLKNLLVQEPYMLMKF